jgi:hypothetical protein
VRRAHVYLFALLLALGCQSRRVSPPSAGAAGAATTASEAAAPIRLTDVSEALGVRFQHTSGAAKRYYLVETMGSGCALFDYDGDGRLDAFLVNSSRLPGFQGKGPFYPALYRQKDDGTFEDVTKQAGLAVECYGMGVAVADYDNDGDPDLYLTAFGSSRLYRNNGKSAGGPPGTFTDVTRAAGVPGPPLGTSAAWFDYDRDGHLDLFVCNYCRWTPALNRACGDSTGPYICGPKYYAGTTSILYRNNGDGTFADVTKKAKVDAPNGKALGIVVWDMDDDGWLDFAVANDTTPNWLFHNQRDGTGGGANRSAPAVRFREISIEAGIGYATTGTARAGMGIDTADVTGDGREAILIGNNSSEGLGLFQPVAGPGQEGSTHFMDVADQVGLFESSMPFSTFGALFADLDLDGFVEIITANGHVNEQVARLTNWIGFAQRLQIFHNEPGAEPTSPPALPDTGREPVSPLSDPTSRTFRDVAETAGEGATTPRVARGLAAGDIDGDGDIDLLVTANNGKAALLRNEALSVVNLSPQPPPRSGEGESNIDVPSRLPASGRREQGAERLTPTQPHWLAIRTRGTKSNRDGIGTRVTIRVAGRTQRAWVRSGSSYCSDSEHVARFGLGAATTVDTVELRWPSGIRQTLRDVKADQVLTVTEPSS